MATIEQIRRNPAGAEKAELIRLRQELVNRSIRIDRDIVATNKQINSTDRQTAAIFRALANNEGKALEILTTSAEVALSSTPEYDHEFFRPGLLSAVNSPGIITAKIRGKNIIVDIDMNAAAGSIENYAQAVKRARSLLGVKGKISPESALKFWTEKIYGPGRLGTQVTRKKKNKKTGEETSVDITAQYANKYAHTMAARISRYAAGKMAPWWPLLEYGNVSYQMPGAQNESGFPSNFPTHFVQKAEDKIRELLESSYSVEFQKELRPFKEKLEDLQEQNKENERDRALLEELLSGAGKTKQEIALEKIRRKLRERYAETKADYDRIERLIDRLAAGERITEKITIGRGVRIRVIQILNELNLEYKDLQK